MLQILLTFNKTVRMWVLSHRQVNVNASEMSSSFESFLCRHKSAELPAKSIFVFRSENSACNRIFRLEAVKKMNIASLLNSKTYAKHILNCKSLAWALVLSHISSSKTDGAWRTFLDSAINPRYYIDGRITFIRIYMYLCIYTALYTVTKHEYPGVLKCFLSFNKNRKTLIR